MTDTPSFVTAGADGVTPQQFPDNINVESMKFQSSDIFLMQHRPDTHIRPGFVEFGAAAQVHMLLGIYNQPADYR